MSKRAPPPPPEEYAQLKAFYASRGIPKTEEDIAKSIAFFSSPESGGFPAMWAGLEQKYGLGAAPQQQRPPAPAASPSTPHSMPSVATPDQRPIGTESTPQRRSVEKQSQFRRLKDYYAGKQLPRTDDELWKVVDKYGDDPDTTGGFEQMWVNLHAKFGQPTAAQASSHGAASSAPAPVSATNAPASAAPAPPSTPPPTTASPPPPTPDHSPATTPPALQAGTLATLPAAPAANATKPFDVRSSASRSSAQTKTSIDEFNQQLAAVKDFYASIGVTKTEQEVRDAVSIFAADGAYDAMWAQLRTKYTGPARTAKTTAPVIKLNPRDDPKRNAEALKQFYSENNISRPDNQIDSTIAHYLRREGRFAEMWRDIYTRYPLLKKPPLALELAGSLERQTRIDHLKQYFDGHRMPRTDVELEVIDMYAHPEESRVTFAMATAVLQGRWDRLTHEWVAPKERNVLHLTLMLSGGDYLRYEQAPPDMQAKFGAFVASHLAQLTHLDGEWFTFKRVSRPFVIDLELNAGPDQEIVVVSAMEMLSRRVDGGSLNMVSIREAYRTMLKGNPTQLVASGFSALSTSRMVDAQEAELLRTLLGEPNSLNPAWTSAALQKYRALTERVMSRTTVGASPSNVAKGTLLERGEGAVKVHRGLCINTPAFDGARTLDDFSGHTRHFDRTATAAEQLYMAPAIDKSTVADASSNKSTSASRQARLRALGGSLMRASTGASTTPPPPFDRNMDPDAAARLGKPLHVYRVGDTAENRREEDWRYAERLRVERAAVAHAPSSTYLDTLWR